MAMKSAQVSTHHAPPTPPLAPAPPPPPPSPSSTVSPAFTKSRHDSVATNSPSGCDVPLELLAAVLPPRIRHPAPAAAATAGSPPRHASDEDQADAALDPKLLKYPRRRPVPVPVVPLSEASVAGEGGIGMRFDISSAAPVDVDNTVRVSAPQRAAPAPAAAPLPLPSSRSASPGALSTAGEELTGAIAGCRSGCCRRQGAQGVGGGLRCFCFCSSSCFCC